jgi:hypothetical protein
MWVQQYSVSSAATGSTVAGARHDLLRGSQRGIQAWLARLEGLRASRSACTLHISCLVCPGFPGRLRHSASRALARGTPVADMVPFGLCLSGRVSLRGGRQTRPAVEDDKVAVSGPLSGSAASSAGRLILRGTRSSR